MIITVERITEQRQLFQHIRDVVQVMKENADWYLACLEASDQAGGPAALAMLTSHSAAIASLLTKLDVQIGSLDNRIHALSASETFRRRRQVNQKEEEEIAVRKKRQLTQEEETALSELLQILSSFLEQMELFLQLLIGPRALIGCRASPDSISVTVYDSVGFDVVNAYVLNKKSVVDCRASAGDGTISNPFTLSLVPSGPCGITGSGTNADPYTVKVLAVRSDILESRRDVVFDVTCTGPTSQQVLAGIEVSDVTFNQGRAETRTENVMLEVIDGGGNAVTTCALGEDIRLRLTLVPSTTARGVRAINVDSSPSSDPTAATVNLLANGCPVSSNPPAAVLAAGFNAVAPNPGNVVISGVFKCYKFPDVTTLRFEAEIQFCTADNDQSCTTQPACGVRKRSVTEEKSESVSATVTVYVNEEARAAAAGGGNSTATLTTSRPAPAEKLNIWTSTAFLATLCACAVLMLLVMLMAALVILRSRSRVDKS
ncbi:uncharacterized protein LOC106174773 [Lingula anatina]|uniref:Uncharacterized protein LOC106174773 n=1 Tax=Lingula anatina TaxID=7574 RepID=A0A1S3JNH2_LINAN|nr:uncharacterized protein LOC106174773 [Lingula anatina]|eukprot:XP_013411913.1 uncharacterized protein LOC106174773 [Lingula anatina]